MANSPKSINRRQFLAGAGATALTFTVLKPQTVRAYVANSKVRLGLVGCGGRGSWIASLFQDHGGYEIAGVADYFTDRADGVGDKFGLPADRRFSGLSGYKRLIDSGVDAIAIESPPYFHPEQAAAAVDAGKHVFLAKPVAVDVPGCDSVAASGRKATENNLVYLVDFQTRATDIFIDAIGTVHQGAIGQLAFGESSYHAGSPWTRQEADLRDDPTNPENRVRAWGLDRALSGDIITEQNIHTLDVMNWIMQVPPLSASGTGGKRVRTDPGNCWDHFTVLFQYPDDLGITFTSRQFEGHGAWEGIANRMFGSKGVLETNYFGEVVVRGENPIPAKTAPGIYTEAVVTNIKTFYDSIQNGDHSNPTVEPSVQSNLVTILGRKAAYEKREVTWNEILRDDEVLDPGLKGLKD
jgi:myo-inositol 2-dehydrogenase / D-chiro-inositol 1-dehydrogenase